MTKVRIAELEPGESGWCSQRSLVMVGAKGFIDGTGFVYDGESPVATLEINRHEDYITVWQDTITPNHIYLEYQDDRFIPVEYD